MIDELRSVSGFGERIKSERQRVKMNQTEMAELAGVSKTSQVNYEQEQRIPDARYLAAISDKVDVLYIVTGEHTPDRNPKALDAQVIESILTAIDAWAVERKKPISIQVRAELLAVFLKQMMASGKIDPDLMRTTLRLVK